MPSFSTIAQDPQIRDLVQSNTLMRQFKDALFPDLIYRADSDPELWPGQVGDEMVFSGKGLISPKTKPLKPRTEMQPSTYTMEQWSAQLNQWADTIDTHIPTSILACVDLFMSNAQQIGMAGAQSVNRVARNTLYNAAVSGQTVADGAGVTTASLRVKHLNGFTKARRPDLAAGSKVRFRDVSSTNPLSATLEGAGTVSIIGYTSDDPDGDEFGPGVLTLSATASWSDRAYLLASDRTFLVRVGGGLKIDPMTTANLPKLSDVEACVARLQDYNVKPYADGYFHAHLDSTSVSKMFQDSDLQRLNTSLPDYYMYKKMSLGQILGTAFVKNPEAPRADTVSSDENLALEMANPSGVGIRRILFTGMGFLKEYYNDQSLYLTDAGMTGKLAEPTITNDGITVNAERISLIMRAAQNRLQDEVSTSYRFVGCFVPRTDAATGDAARYKRAVICEHAV